uniref:Uncharacterized protein n=1 Tax=Tanacetum cinerariifolium TaxID=118510 RepID=A0A6L2N4Z9_TANCI|nr:hypothetical protein [Tanacetum cinerariifolium]
MASAIICLATNRTFNFSKMIFEGMLKNLDSPILQGEGSTVPVESNHTPSDEAASTGVDVRHRGAATTVSSLDAGHGSGNIDKTLSMPHDSPLPRVNTLGSDEGSMTLNELRVLCTKLSQKVESLEVDLKQTKKVYGAAYTMLIMKVKRLEKSIKSSQVRRRAKIVVSEDEELKDPSKQERSMIEEIDQDAKVHLVTPTQVNTHGEAQSQEISTPGMVDKGKAIMKESEPEFTTIKLQQRQERAGYEAVIRLQEQLEKEERQRIVRVHEEASSFNVEE